MGSEIKCICNTLERINGFYSIGEFERFQGFVDDLTKDRDLVEIPVRKKYAGFNEQWYKCSGCGQVWRLVHPEFPFKGIWDIVK